VINCLLVQPVPLSEQNGRLRGYIVSCQQMHETENNRRLLHTNVTYAVIGQVALPISLRLIGPLCSEFQSIHMFIFLILHITRCWSPYNYRLLQSLCIIYDCLLSRLLYNRHIRLPGVSAGRATVEAAQLERLRWRHRGQVH